MTVSKAWGTAASPLELEELSADDCPQRLEERRPRQRDVSATAPAQSKPRRHPTRSVAACRRMTAAHAAVSC